MGGVLGMARPGHGGDGMDHLGIAAEDGEPLLGGPVARGGAARAGAGVGHGFGVGVAVAVGVHGVAGGVADHHRHRAGHSRFGRGRAADVRRAVPVGAHQPALPVVIGEGVVHVGVRGHHLAVVVGGGGDGGVGGLGHQGFALNDHVHLVDRAGVGVGIARGIVDAGARHLALSPGRNKSALVVIPVGNHHHRMAAGPVVARGVGGVDRKRDHGLALQNYETLINAACRHTAFLGVHVVGGIVA